MLGPGFGAGCVAQKTSSSLEYDAAVPSNSTLTVSVNPAPANSYYDPPPPLRYRGAPSPGTARTKFRVRLVGRRQRHRDRAVRRVADQPIRHAVDAAEREVAAPEAAEREAGDTCARRERERLGVGAGGLRLGFGRIVASEIEAPNMLASPV